MNKWSFSFSVFILLVCSCSRPLYTTIAFTGYEDLTNVSALSFDTVQVEPVYLGSKIFDDSADSSRYWDIYMINPAYNLRHHCSSYNALIVNDSRDYLTLGKDTIRISTIFKDKIAKFRILQILEFSLKDNRYWIVVGSDMLEGGNRPIHHVVFLIKFQSTGVTTIIPPMTLNGGHSNTQPFAPFYFNDFNNDGKLDFLQWNEKEKICMYSEINHFFKKTNHFIKLKRKTDDMGNYLYLINKKESHWPGTFRSSTEQTVKQLVYEHYMFLNGDGYY
ncbi:MAG TPA: hypothetical protein VK168_06625 [Saprospiraceae bacterium]|nr:hypothetical protein [Saprospiraceae bacterium]